MKRGRENETGDPNGENWRPNALEAHSQSQSLIENQENPWLNRCIGSNPVAHARYAGDSS